MEFRNCCIQEKKSAYVSQCVFFDRSHSGVVNVYDDSYLQSFRPKPQKAIMNLTTPCTSMVFNSQTELLALASDYTDKAVKLVRTPRQPTKFLPWVLRKWSHFSRLNKVVNLISFTDSPSIVNGLFKLPGESRSFANTFVLGFFNSKWLFCCR